MSGKTDHVGVTTMRMETLYQGHLHPLLEQPETDMSQPWNQTLASTLRSKHSSKELFEQLVNSIQNIYMSPRHNSALTIKKNHAHKALGCPRLPQGTNYRCLLCVLNGPSAIWQLGAIFLHEEKEYRKNKGANETNILLTKMAKNPLNYRY
jgi:hypothetical protein